MRESTIPDSTLLALMCEGSTHPKEDLRLALAEDTIERAAPGDLGAGLVRRILTRPAKSASETKQYDRSASRVKARADAMHKFLEGGEA